jgi:hypothetical protein
MAKLKETVANHAPPGGGGGSYAELAIAHIRAHGGERVVLSGTREQGHKPAQWRAWIAYFAWLDGQTVPRGRKAATHASRRQITVPAEWPREFDASAPPPQSLPPSEPSAAPERRRELANMLRRVMADIELAEKRPPTFDVRWRDMTLDQAEDRLAKLTADYAARPTTLSPALARGYATRKPETAA